MSIIYLIGALVMVVILGYAYFLLVTANKQKGVTRVIGQALSALLVLLLLLLIILYKTGIAETPSFMPEKPSTRIMRGMSGYVTGMMAEDERTIDEFVNSLKANPGVYEKFKEKFER